MRRGDRVVVVDASPTKGGKRFPLKQGEAYFVANVGVHGRSIALVGHRGFWLAERFEVRHG